MKSHHNSVLEKQYEKTLNMSNSNLYNRLLGSPFRKTTTAASYDPFYLTIFLDSIKLEQFKAIDFSQMTVDNYKVVSLIRHELAHWIDHISTLWGQKNLVLLFNAMNAWANGNEAEFWRIKLLNLAYSSERFNEYYSEVYLKHSGGFKDLWKFNLTCGVRFGLDGQVLNNKPILFTKFATSKGEPISRVPVSIESVLESNAIFEEYSFRIAFASQLDDVVEKAIQLRQINKELEGLLYSTDLTVYSVVAHLIATHNGINNIPKAYEVSSSLGTLLLNMPSEIHSRMKYTMRNGPEWDQRALAMIKNADIGYGFYNMMINLIDKYGKDAYSLEKVLDASDLPLVEDMELATFSEMTLNIADLTSGPFRTFGTSLLNMGIEAFKFRGLDGKKPGFDEWFFRKKLFPDFLPGDVYPDTNAINFFDTLDKVKQSGKMTIEEKFAMFEIFEMKFDSFNSICGV